MTSENKLEYRDLYKHFDGLQVFADVTFAVPAGRITALIGPNGAGKSTLINLTGVFPPDGGSVFKDGSALAHFAAPQALERSLARTFQNVRVFPSLSVLDNVMVAFPNQPGDAPWRMFGRAATKTEERNRLLALEYSNASA